MRSASAASTDRLLDGMIVPALTTVTARADSLGVADSMRGVAATMLARRVMADARPSSTGSCPRSSCYTRVDAAALDVLNRP